MKNHSPIIQQRPDTHWLYSLATQLPFAPNTLEAALHKLGILPDKATWLHWLSLLLLGLGSGFFLSGTVFFFAYNWEEMHRFTRFGILLSGIVITAIVAWWQGINNLLGKLSLTASAVLTGILLATFGMVYQTGADSFMLFGSWAILILPWVLVSRFQPLWLIELVIIKIAFFTWLDSSSIFDKYPEEQVITFVILTLTSINFIVLFLRERTTLIHQPINSARWFPRLLIVWLLLILSYTPLTAIIAGNMSSAAYQGILVLLYFLTLAGLTYYALSIHHDLFVFACVLLSIISILITLLIKGLNFDHDTTFNLMLVGLAIAGMTTLASKMLLSTARRWKVATEGAVS